MSKEELNELKPGTTPNRVKQVLENFNGTHRNVIGPIDLPEDVKKMLWKNLTAVLNDSEQKPNHYEALVAMKILSRDKRGLDDIVDSSIIDTLLLHAGLIETTTARENRDKESVLESERCLSNLLLQCPVAQTICCSNAAIPGIFEQVMKYKESSTPLEIRTFDMKLLFLVTALCQQTRRPVFLEHRGLIRLTDLLSQLLSESTDRVATGEASASTGTPKLNAEEVLFIKETLKVLFNITLDVDGTLDEEEESHFTNTCAKLQMLLLIEAEVNKHEVVSGVINLLTNFGKTCTLPLMEFPDKTIVGESFVELEYDGKCMNAAQKLIDHLEETIDKPEINLKDSLTPILNVVCNLSRFHRPIRKYYRLRVLPPLRETKTRPEEGNTLRNRLCKLLTSPIMDVSSMVAEFIFILCKESVARMIKYTGYGNAAGLLNRRGLMLGGKSTGQEDYSDAEDDSDTEEYSRDAHKVNPITGCVENKPKVSPFEGMTEEQKEYEAMKLVNLINDLNNVGVIKPACVNEDGRTQPVEHVLQLRDELERVRGQQEEEEED